MKRILPALVVVLVHVIGACGAAPVPVTIVGSEPATGRLPTDVTPTAYALDIRIVPSEERFDGSSEISVTLSEPRNRVWLHGTELTVTEAVAVTAQGEEWPGEWSGGEGEDSFSSLSFDRVLPAGDYTLRIAYSAAFDDGLDSLYSVAVDEDHYAFTQMEPLAARRAFPCFDEPHFKTPFDVTLRVREDDVAIANAPAGGEVQDGEGMKAVRFQTSRPMPTYLVAFAVGPFDVVDSGGIPANDVREEPLPFRGVAVRGRGAELAYAMQHTPAMLHILEEYVGSAYPFAKLDIIAVPDFAAGAMENPGAVTFRDTLLLLSEESPIRARRSFAFVMAHELAHMWFGNLVTMEWWDDLWLNEAMATWAEARVLQAWDESYEANLSLVEWGAWAMGADSMPNARSIQNPIGSSHDIHAAFDGITYSKGGAVVGMVERWMGEETFRAGVQAYLQEHEWGTATGDDFLRALDAAAGSDVSTAMRSFLTQPGVPFLEPELVCDSDGVRVRFQQSRYVPVGSSASREATWDVPVCIRYPQRRGSARTCGLVSGQGSEIALEGNRCPEWILPNADGDGYYRYSIDPGQLTQLVDKGVRQLDVADRLSLVSSLVAAFNNGSMEPATVLQALLRLSRDSHYAVSTAPLGFFRTLETRLLADDEVSNFRVRLRQAYAPVMRRARWTPSARDSFAVRMLRSRLFPFMAEVARDPGARRQAATRGRQWLAAAAGEGEEHDALGAMLTVAMQDGDESLFEAGVTRLSELDDGNERRQVLLALGSVRDEGRAARARALSLGEGLRTNERLLPLYRQFGDRDTRDAAWAWLQESYPALREQLSEGQAAGTTRLAGAYCDADQLGPVSEFFAERVAELPSGERSLETALNRIRLCVALRAAQGPGLAEWLD